jgi:hypothetical protein
MLIVIHHLVIELFLILSFILMDDVVENLWRHVLRSSHGELGNVFELEAGTVIN